MSQRNGNRKPFQLKRQTNMHDVSVVVNLDDFIDYTVMNHDVGTNETVDDKVNTDDGDDTLLAYMAGRTSSAGDIRQVLAAKSVPDKKNKST